MKSPFKLTATSNKKKVKLLIIKRLRSSSLRYQVVQLIVMALRAIVIAAMPDFKVVIVDVKHVVMFE